MELRRKSGSKGIRLGSFVAFSIEPVCLGATLVHDRGISLVGWHNHAAGTRFRARQRPIVSGLGDLSSADRCLQPDRVRALWDRQTSRDSEEAADF